MKIISFNYNYLIQWCGQKSVMLYWFIKTSSIENCPWIENRISIKSPSCFFLRSWYSFWSGYFLTVNYSGSLLTSLSLLFLVSGPSSGSAPAGSGLLISFSESSSAVSVVLLGEWGVVVGCHYLYEDMIFSSRRVYDYGSIVIIYVIGRIVGYSSVAIGSARHSIISAVIIDYGFLVTVIIGDIIVCYTIVVNLWSFHTACQLYQIRWDSGVKSCWPYPWSWLAFSALSTCIVWLGTQFAGSVSSGPLGSSHLVVVLGHQLWVIPSSYLCLCGCVSTFQNIVGSDNRSVDSFLS